MFKVCALALAFIASTAVSAQGDFDWNITENPTNFADVEFSDSANDAEVTLNYLASQKTTTVAIYDYANCNSTDGANGAITTASAPTRDDETLEVPLNIIQANIAGSSFYTASGANNETGTIDFCVRVDLTADISGSPESINFHESKISIEIDMTEGFEVIGVVTNRTEATQTDKNATLEYDVQAYECSDVGTEVSKQYTQGDFLEICVETNGTGVKVANVIEMTLSGDTNYTSVDGTDASTSALTERTCGAAGCKVKTMLVSDFFVNANPAPIDVDGTCVMEFERARRLSSVSVRGLQENANEKFGLTVPLQPMNIAEETGGEIDDSMADSAAASTYVGVASFVVAVFSFFLM